MGLFERPRPEGVEVTALDLCAPEYLGRTVLYVPEGTRAWKEARRRLGHDPQVKRCDYWEHGEGDEPTVYLGITGLEWGTYCMAPDDVIVLASEG